MSFQPVVPLQGYEGWLFLDRTLEGQKQALAETPRTIADTQYFSEQISGVRTAEDLVGDFRLLKVALGAFGLDADIGNKYFIRKVLEEGTSSPEALANKLADKSYREFSDAFGFGDGDLARTGLTGFAEEIVASYRDRQFEIAVGDHNEDFRLALNAKRAVAEIATGDLSTDGQWYAIMGSTPLRTVFETAFGLPATFSALDLEDQLAVFRDKAKAAFGDGEIRQFSDAARMEELIRTFLLRSELDDASAALSSSSIALTLLSSTNTR